MNWKQERIRRKKIRQNRKMFKGATNDLVAAILKDAYSSAKVFSFLRTKE